MNQPERMPALLQMFAEVDPGTNAMGPYVHVCAFLTVMTSLMWERLQAQRFLQLLLRAGESVQSEPVASAYVCFGHAWYVRALGADPQLVVEQADKSVRCLILAEDLRTLIQPQILLGVAQADLGAWADGEATLRSALATATRLQDPLPIASAQMYLATVLVEREQPGAQEDAVSLARTVIEAGVSAAYSGVSRGVMAEVHRQRGQLADARREAEAARSCLDGMPVFLPAIIRTLIEVALAEGAPAAATAIAASGRELLAIRRGPTFGEVALRVAIARALYESGDVAGARSELDEALAGIRVRVDKIREPAVRQQFLTRREHRLAYAMAVELGADAPVLALKW